LCSALGGAELIGRLRIPQRGDARPIGKGLDQERKLLTIGRMNNRLF
jgi:hypothetical protein